MEELKLQLEAMQQRWEDDHGHLVRLEAAGEGAHVGVQRERKLRRFSGSAFDLSFVDWVEETRAWLREQFLKNVRRVHWRWDLKRRADISSDVDSEAPTETKIRVGVSSQEVATEGMAAEISNDVDSEAPTETKIRVGVSSQEVATEGMAAEISNDVDSEAPTESKIRVGVSSQEFATEGMAAEIANDVDSEAPTETKIRVGVSSQEVATGGMAAEISSDVDSEAPAETKIQVGVSSQEVETEMVEMTSIRRRRRRLRYESACLRKKL